MIEPEQIMLLVFRAVDKATGQKSMTFIAENQAKRAAGAMPWGEVEAVTIPVDQSFKESDLLRDWAL